MSAPSPTTPPYSWQPITPGYTDVLASMQNQHINQNIYTSTDKLMGSINSSNQYLTAGLNNLGKEVTQTSLGLRDAVERGNLVISNSIERNAGDIKLNTTMMDAANRQAASDTARDILRTIDQNSSAHETTMERIGSNLNGAVERTSGQNVSAVERNGGNIMTAIEKVAGEGRLTTTVTDAASRQAAADSARDVMGAVERTGANNHSTTQSIGSNILSTIERVAGEGRVTTTMTDAASRQAAADSARDIMGAVERNGSNIHAVVQTVAGALSTAVERNGGETRTAIANASASTNDLVSDARGQIMTDINRTTNEIISNNMQNLNTLSKSILDSAWENRVGIQTSITEGIKNTGAVQQQSANQYASTLLEGQKSTALLTLDGANHYASLMLEQQKVKEYIASKTDGHFAMNQLEMQKVKESLAAQAAQNFAALQLDQHKIKESIQAQMADAKYDALKNTQFLADKMCECCCDVKQKIDGVDRDRLRDGYSVERTENHILRAAELFDRRWDRRDRRGDDDDRRGGRGDDRRGDDRR